MQRTLLLHGKTAFEKVHAILQRKQQAPLDSLALTNEDIAAITAFHQQRQKVVALNEVLLAANREINLVKERAASASIASLNVTSWLFGLREIVFVRMCSCYAMTT